MHSPLLQSLSALGSSPLLPNSLLLKRTNCKRKPQALHQTEYKTNNPQKQKDSSATTQKDKNTRRQMGATVYLFMKEVCFLFLKKEKEKKEKAKYLSSKGSGMNGIQPVSLRWLRGEEDEAVRSPVGCLFPPPRHYRQHCSMSWFVWHKISSICFTGSPRAVYQGALHNSIHTLLAAGCQ